MGHDLQYRAVSPRRRHGIPDGGLPSAGQHRALCLQTTDYGASWESLSQTIPRSVFSYVHVIREDPVRPGLLYLGTENALYVSLDDGENWT